MSEHELNHDFGEEHFGPSLPPALLESRLNAKTQSSQHHESPMLVLSSSSKKRRQLGPSKPDESLLVNSSSLDDNSETTFLNETAQTVTVIGPLPMSSNLQDSDNTHKKDTEFGHVKKFIKFTERKIPSTEEGIQESSKLKRPEWMVNPSLVSSTIKLPNRNIRSFASRSKVSLEKTSLESDHLDTPLVSERDVEYQHQIKLYNETHRKDSLMMLHEHRLNETSQESFERQPFDWKRDISVSGPMTHQQRGDIIRKASELNNRFSSSRSNSRFL